MRRWLRYVVVTSLSLCMAFAAATPAQAMSREGTWRGTTSEGYGIRFRVNEAQRVVLVTFKVDIEGAFCEGAITWTATGIRAPIRADNTFVVTGQDGLDRFRVRGQFVARNRAEGLVTTSTISGCLGSGRATWVARRVL
ncbi:MAG TPA: hypothetical protein VF235_04280 [Actinomycetota bacterium]